MGLISRIIMAAIVAAVVGFLLAIVLGPLLLTLKAPPLTFIGNILTDWGWPIGFICGIWYFFAGGSFGLPTFGGPKA